MKLIKSIELLENTRFVRGQRAEEEDFDVAMAWVEWVLEHEKGAE